MKRLLVLISFVLMLPAEAHAQKYSTAQLCKILQPCQPPAQYASGPYLAKPVIRHVTLKQIQVVCDKGHSRLRRVWTPQGNETMHDVSSNADNDILGCAQLNANACIVYVPSNLKSVLPDLYRLVVAHELAHCRGWVH